jgi:hypothetical protein
VTYPWLRRLFGELDVEVRPAEMSMSVRCQGCGLQYAGGRGVRGVFAQPRRLIDPRFVRMLWQVKRFHRRASAFLRTTGDENLTTGDDGSSHWSRVWPTPEENPGHAGLELWMAAYRHQIVGRPASWFDWRDDTNR